MVLMDVVLEAVSSTSTTDNNEFPKEKNFRDAKSTLTFSFSFPFPFPSLFTVFDALTPYSNGDIIFFLQMLGPSWS
jgi:hypothetical protein